MAIRHVGRAIEEDFQSKCGVKFTAIFTPHFIDMMMQRSEIFTPVLATKFRASLPELFDLMRQYNDKCVHKHVGQSYVYMKRKFNDHPSRKRWGVELISVTPDVHAHTEELKYSIPLD